MGKNAQRNLSEVNLGNETYHRGYGDGVAGHPKTIKKSHRHAHRYHIGYRHGADERARNAKTGLHVQDGFGVTQVHHTAPKNAVVEALIRQQDRAPVTFWKRLRSWLVGV